MNDSKTIVATLRELMSDATLLVRQEVSLARAEAEEKVDQIQTGLIAVGAGLLLAAISLIVLVQALVAALSNIMPPSLAALIVGITLAIAAFVSVTIGGEQLKPKNLAPRRTMRSIRDSAETIKEAQ